MPRRAVLLLALLRSSRTATMKLDGLRRGVSVLLLVVAGLSASDTAVRAQLRALVIGGNRATFGVFEIPAGQQASVATVHVRTGGSVDAGQAAGCAGTVRREPDAIIMLRAPTQRLAFQVRNATGPVTIVVNDARGTWHCSPAEPRLVIEQPDVGQYDVWVGGTSAEEDHEADLVWAHLGTQGAFAAVGPAPTTPSAAPTAQTSLAPGSVFDTGQSVRATAPDPVDPGWVVDPYFRRRGVPSVGSEREWVRRPSSSAQHEVLVIATETEINANIGYAEIVRLSASQTRSSAYLVVRSWQATHTVTYEGPAPAVGGPDDRYFVAEVVYGHMQEMRCASTSREDAMRLQAEYEDYSGSTDGRYRVDRQRCTVVARGLVGQSEALFARDPASLGRLYTLGPPAPIFVTYRAMPRQASRTRQYEVVLVRVDFPQGPAGSGSDRWDDFPADGRPEIRAEFACRGQAWLRIGPHTGGNCPDDSASCEFQAPLCGGVPFVVSEDSPLALHVWDEDFAGARTDVRRPFVFTSLAPTRPGTQDVVMVQDGVTVTLRAIER